MTHGYMTLQYCYWKMTTCPTRLRIFLRQDGTGCLLAPTCLYKCSGCSHDLAELVGEPRHHPGAAVVEQRVVLVGRDQEGHIKTVLLKSQIYSNNTKQISCSQSVRAADVRLRALLLSS